MVWEISLLYPPWRESDPFLKRQEKLASKDDARGLPSQVERMERPVRENPCHVGSLRFQLTILTYSLTFGLLASKPRLERF